jgi:hypothetical protein
VGLSVGRQRGEVDQLGEEPTAVGVERLGAESTMSVITNDTSVGGG